MQYFPELPALAPEARSTGRGYLRYEDVAQDGRVMLAALPHSVGTVVWGRGLAGHPISAQARDAGIIPITTRIIIAGDDGRVPVGKPLEAAGGFQLAHTTDVAGDPDKLILNLWVELHGVSGRTHAAPPPDAGQPVPVGRVFVEHVFTRLFAPPAQRKVRRFEHPDLPAVPPGRQDWRRPSALLEAPDGFRPLEPALAADEATVAFGVMHTDSNQHVNSLIYPRMFEEALLRRLVQLGRPAKLLARWAEVAYRKPCFAGQEVRILLRTFEQDGAIGAVGCFVSDAAPEPERAHCTVRMLLEP